jgi:iron complex outermembrane receptor protein
MFLPYRLLTAAAIGALATAGGVALTPSPARAENAAVSESTTLPTVLVTARRREENLQDTPISVTALSADALARQNITSTDKLDLVTPGLEFANYGPLSGNNSAAQVFIRGIGQTDPTAAVDPGVGIYVDDVYMGRAIGGVMEFRDIDSVQVLRGPQGTLFGRNTIGGAILVKTKDPTNELGADFRIKTGTGNLIEGFGAVNVPLTEGLAARITGGVRKRDGYVTRIVDGVDLGNDNTATFTGKTLWTPTDTLRIELKGDYTREKENGSPFVFKAINEAAVFPIAVSVGAGCPGATFPPPVPVPNINDPRCANNYWYKGRYTNGGTAAVYSTVKNWGFSGHVDWNASHWLTLKSITAYRDLHWTGARDADNTPFVILDTAIDSSTTQFSQEFQGLVDFGRVNGVVGAYYFDESTDDQLRVHFSPPAPFVLSGTTSSKDLSIVHLGTKSYALFSQWNVEIVQNLNLSGGIRYTREDKTIQGIWTNLLATSPEPNPLSSASPLYVDPRQFKNTFSSVTGSASLQYRWSDSLLTYFSWSQGFKSGGFNQRYNAPAPNLEPVPFNEETADNYEIGFKSDLAGNLRLNTSAFITKYDNMQLVYRLGVVPLLFNAGRATIEGFEAELTYAPTRDLTIDGSLGYLHDKFNQITNVPGTTATVGPGNSLPFTPTWKAHLAAAYTLRPFGDDFELTPRVTYSYTSSQFFDAANTVEVAQTKGVNLIDLSIRFDDTKRQWSLTFGIDNLTNLSYPVAGNSSLSTAAGYAEIVYSRRRQWFLQLTKSL